MTAMGLKFYALTILSATCASSYAQERRLQPLVEGDFSSGLPQTFVLRADAGDVIFGTFKPQGTTNATPISVTFYDSDNSKVDELVAYYSAEWPIGFVAPKSGTYRIRITPPASGGGSYKLTTEKQTARERTAGVTVTATVRFESPRVVQLAKEVTAGKAGAVSQFWLEAKERGGPLIESIKGDEKNVLVTFLWRETYDTYNVLVDWSGPAPQDYYMSHVPKTNVWYKTWRLRRGSRFSYNLAPNDRPARPGDAHYTAQRDPLNPRVANPLVAYGHSILETPGAPDESWFSRTPAVRGSITQHSLDSVLLKKRREISVYTPPGYSLSNGPYPLLILFDGGAYISNLGAPNTLDNLINEHRIRPTVVCFVSDARGVSANQEQAYGAAMATELVPWIRSSYAVATNPKDVVIGGYSAGGGMAGSIAFNYPDIFGNVLLQSGGGRLVPLYVNAPKLPLRFYIDQGLYEYGSWPFLSPDEQAVDGWFDEDLPPQGPNWLLRTRLLRTVLQAKGYDVTYHETGGIHEFVHWRATLADALIALLGLQLQ